MFHLTFLLRNYHYLIELQYSDNSYYFVNRDIVLLAGVLLVLLPISSVWRHGEKADTRSLALCSVFLTVIGSVLLFSHVASCTLLVLPLLLMMLLSRNAVDFILFSLLPAIVFLAEIEWNHHVIYFTENSPFPQSK